MIQNENDNEPNDHFYDIAITAIGFEQRCRWVSETKNVRAKLGIGLEFGFLAEGSYQENHSFFKTLGFTIIRGLHDDPVNSLISLVDEVSFEKNELKVFIDISAMSREMIANTVLFLEKLRLKHTLYVTTSYAPSKFTGAYKPAPIRLASPIKPSLAGWSAYPDRPVGALFGLGCEPGLALGALQFLEPKKAWIFSPIGIDSNFDSELKIANEHINDIFDITQFEYQIQNPTITRGKIEALLNAVDRDFRMVLIPFGPKIFAWLCLVTVVHTKRRSTGVWAFSSKEDALIVDRKAEGPIVWHNFILKKL